MIPPGPLLWHFENNTTNDPSIELDLEEVKKLVRDIGFEISVSSCLMTCLLASKQIDRVQKERSIDTTYTSNAEGMLGYVYHAEFWVATKVI